MEPDKNLCRRWTVAIAQLRHRALKARRAPIPPDVADIVEQSLALCDEVVRDLAGAAMEFDDYKLRLDSQATLWAHVFDQMPSPCVETDGNGIITAANREAALLLNTSVRHLNARLLLHFAEHREAFGNLLRELSAVAEKQTVSLVIRPRERAPLRVEAVVIPRTPGDSSVWLWFLIAAERAHVSGRRTVAKASDDEVLRSSIAS